jgi:hypothetical protein
MSLPSLMTWFTISLLLSVMPSFNGYHVLLTYLQMMLSQIWEAKKNFLTTCFAKTIYYILTQLPQKQSYGNKEDTLMKLI